jgi:hypothetical protein
MGKRLATGVEAFAVEKSVKYSNVNGEANSVMD